MNNLSHTFRNALDPFNPVLPVGFTIHMTLDRNLVKSQSDAARLGLNATQSQYDDLNRQVKRAAKDLILKRSEFFKSYKILESLENTQREKLENEKLEYQNDHSTTYQILMYSQDLAQAELAKVRASYSIQIIDAQIRQLRIEDS